MTSALTRSNILIVDDTPENLTLLRQMLTEKGFLVRPAISGEVALNSVQTNLPDLILLDILMPGMDGYEVCRRLKSQERTRDIPVIFISALTEPENKVRAFHEGGVDYITKPFQTDEVLARVTTHLQIFSMQKTLEKKNQDLKTAIDEIKQLRSFLPICCHCKSIRDDQGYWERVETYISKFSGVTFSHCICPECAVEHYSEYLTKEGGG